MDNRLPHRTPSPGLPPQHGYQLDDNPYGVQPNPHLDIPPMGPGRYSPGDSLQHMQTPVSGRAYPGYIAGTVLTSLATALGRKPRGL